MTHQSSRRQSEDDTANVNKVVVGANGSISVAWRGQREKNLLYFEEIVHRGGHFSFGNSAASTSSFLSHCLPVKWFNSARVSFATSCVLINGNASVDE